MSRFDDEPHFNPSEDPKRPLHESRLARAGVTIVVFGGLVHLLGLFPQLINLDLNSGIGILQLFVVLVGIGIWTVGGYLYAYATRHRERALRLRQDIGLRLGMTGYVFCLAAGMADVLGIGSHSPDVVRPFLGNWQRLGLTIGMATIVFGILLYAGRYNPPDTTVTSDDLLPGTDETDGPPLASDDPDAAESGSEPPPWVGPA